MAADPQRPLYHPVAPPREDHRLVTGAGRFVADLAPPGTLQLAFARSTEAHALILGIDTTEATRAEGVAMVATAADLDLPDIPGRSVAVDPAGFSRPHLAGERVRYVGEPIAVVAAERAPQAIDAAELIWVEYDPLQVVTDPAAAVNDQTILHPAAGSNVVERWELGSPDGADQGEVAVELTVHNQRLAPVAVEPLAILVEPGGDRSAHRLVRAPAAPRTPHPARQASWDRACDDQGDRPRCRRRLRDEGDVVPRVRRCRRHGHQAATTGHLGGAPPRALLRGEPTAVAPPTRCGSVAAGMAGSLRADLAELADVGAYPHNGASIPAFSRYVATGLYDFSEVHISTTTVVTNRAPTGSYRGAGRPEAAYAIERAVDAYAGAAGLDPVEVRLANFIRDLPLHHGHRRHLRLGRLRRRTAQGGGTGRSRRGPPAPGRASHMGRTPIGVGSAPSSSGPAAGGHRRVRQGGGGPHREGDGAHRFHLVGAGSRDRLARGGRLGPGDARRPGVARCG